ncbi:MAG: hypothetical protein EWV60_03055 [Microcystis sp. Msp_OC_L_20101000_S702]|jgi:hypothetical protein|uniref:hypothetical protein n=1 Tax=unclassified Microcystis TaxID=2643300 RepID=UPI0011928794|nr:MULTISPECIES: hypothetical protein [unclassified Microcystis]MCZ8049949.1 hypothetical protein [Microcystis sp. LE19-41.2A]MCZ8287328.1 hypothetical protein [Microcystis sp. LE19-59.1C]TRU14338.1 MAG: hypothetical protein EWV60_03055 [Microcystis sp. Msp_OC_L_20101000_S702]
MVLIITQILGGNLGKSNVGFPYLNLTYKIASPPLQKRSPLLLIKKRSPFAFLSQAMAVLKFNPQDDSE